MKYRVKFSATKKKSNLNKSLLKAKRHYRNSQYTFEEPIDFISLFDSFESENITLPIQRKKPSAFANLFFGIKKLFKKLIIRLKEIAQKKKERRLTRPENVYMLFGALCSSLLVSVLSVCIVLLSFFGHYGAPYTTVTVPNLVGTLYEDMDEDENALFSYVIDYVYNPEVTPGHVISQSPPAGTKRRVYTSKKYCLISLTVSYAKSAYILEDLSGRSERDASLTLRSNGLIPKIKNEYSSSVPCGTVIRTFPEADKIMTDGETVTLTISLGPQEIFCSVPSLMGLTETQAVTKIRSAGLVCGNITYSESDLPSGTVISQSLPPKNAVKENTSVDIAVSIGRLNLKLLPDLYGKTIEEAKDILRSYGLVLGTVIPVGSAEAKGSVISQMPLPNTPITSSTVSVDVYVSS